MRIRTQIFSWVFLVTIVPLTALALAATYYVEFLFQKDVQETVTRQLNTLSSELKRDLVSQVELAHGLVKSNAVQEFIPLLKDAERGEVGSEFNINRTRVNHYFEGFQTILQGQYVMRLMDKFGNSFIKVSQNRRSSPVYEGISGVMFAEQEVEGVEFYEQLQKLPREEVSMLTLPHNAQQSSLMEILPILDFVVPLYDEDELVGVLSMTRFGERVDTILNFAPRLYDAKIFLAENNPESENRHGLLLFDDKTEVHLAQVRNEYRYVSELVGVANSNSIMDVPYGSIPLEGKNQTLYYHELFPYPTRLTSWVIGIRIPDAAITEPFQQIRWVIWGIAIISLLISLFLGDIGVRLIARPIRELAQNLLAYARGEHLQRVSTDAQIDEIRDLETAFNTLADSLDQTSDERDKAQHMMLQSAKLASIGQMAAGIGHEINNPLNNILSYAKLLERNADDLTETQQNDLASLKEEAVRASDIIRGILNFARQVPPQYAPFEIAKWLQDTIKLVQQSAKTAGIKIAIDNGTGIVIEGDRGQLQQALINLLINAIQASERDTQVKVQTRKLDNDVMISVIDHGKGIAEESLDSIYDPFYTTKPEGEGSGLGLSISLGIIERHNGRLTLANNPEGGATATMVLPIKQAEAKDDE